MSSLGKAGSVTPRPQRVTARTQSWLEKDQQAQPPPLRLKRSKPEEAARFEAQSQLDVDERWLVYEQLAQVEHEHAGDGNGKGDGNAPEQEEPT